MDTLPLELQQRVCSYLTPKDLKSLRLTSRIYAAAACRNILPRIFLLNHADSFQEIKDIVNHPELSQQVTTLVIDVCRLKQCPRYDHWVRGSANWDLPSMVNQDSEEVKTAPGEIDARTERALRRTKNLEQWQSYQTKAHTQAKKSSQKLMLGYVALAFQKCPKLRNLVIDCERGARGGAGLAAKRNQFYSDIFSSSAAKTEFARRGHWDHTSFTSWDILKPVDDLDRALHSLTILDSNGLGTRSWTLPATSIFCNLKHLWGNSCSTLFLTSIVACAPKLESFGIIDYSQGNASLVESLLGKTSLSNLRVCSIRSYADEKSIIQFLLRQSKTLQSLTIHHLPSYSQPRVWTSFSARLQGRLPHLRHVNLISLVKTPVYNPVTGIYGPVEYITPDDILQDHEHELQKGPIDIEDGQWEDYESLFFP